MVVDKESATNRLVSKTKKWGGSIENILTDYATGTAIIRIRKNNLPYEFRYRGKNAREGLSVLSWSICRLIDCDIREILPFEKTAHEFLAISGSTEPFVEAEEKWFTLLGLKKEASNDDVMRRYKKLAKDFHPDTIQDEQLRLDAQKRFSEISNSYAEIKKARRF